MADIERIVGWLVERAQPSAHPVRNAGIGESIPGKIRWGKSGTCFSLESCAPIKIALPDKGRAIEGILSELRLIFGIGRVSARRLAGEGFGSIRELLSHPRWGPAAQALLDYWGEPIQPRRVYETMSYWLPSSHPLFLSLPGLATPERICFFDLETLGLFGAPIFLGGLGRPRPERGLSITQYLARSLEEEIGALEGVLEELSDCLFLVTYNGKSFDWTAIKERCAYYSLPPPPEVLHLDLLPHARRGFRDALPDFSLETVERGIFGITREDDLPSVEVPRRYTEYLETGDSGLLLPILNHNRQDVETLALLFSHLVERNAG